MVSIRRRGERWLVRWRSGGKLLERTVANEAEALRIKQEREGVESAQAAWGLPGLTVRDLLLAWHARSGLKSARTRETEDQRIRHQLIPYLGDRLVTSIRRGDLEGLAAWTIERGRSGDTAAGALSILRAAIHRALEEGALEAPPVGKGVFASVMKAAKGRTRRQGEGRDAWEPSEVEALLRHGERYGLGLILLIAFHTGARRGEILGLRWEDVNFITRRLRIRRTVDLGSGTKQLKTGAQERVVPLSGPLYAALDRELKRQRRGVLQGRPEPEWVCVMPETSAREGYPARRPGEPWRERTVSQSFRRTCRRAQRDGVRPMPFHCTRHTYITLALGAGHSTRQVATWAGVSPAVIERHYAHAIQEPAHPTAFLDAMGGKA